jgi:hypothetical protein
MSDIKPTMTLVTSQWQGMPTFRMIPATNNTAFEEAIYDPQARALVVFSRFVKQSMHLVPRLSEEGDPMKATKPRPNGKNYKEIRTTLETFPEHYVTVPEEIEHVINLHAENAASYDFKKFLTAPAPSAEISTPMETPMGKMEVVSE